MSALLPRSPWPPALLRSSLRYLLRHPWQIGLSILGVALGVAVVVSVDLANASAQRAFDLSTEAVTGRTTHQVVGGPAGLEEDLYRRLVVEAGIRPAAPVVEGHLRVVEANVPETAPRSLRVLGVDPFAERPFRPYLRSLRRGGDRVGEGSGDGAGEDPDEGAAAGIDVGAFLTRPGAAVLSRRTARELGLGRGDRLAVDALGALDAVETAAEAGDPPQPQALTLVGYLEPSADTAPQALDALVVVDVATAQELLGRPGRLSRIDLIAPQGSAESSEAAEIFLARVRAQLPEGARLLSAAARSRTTREMTRAFRLNLQALGLLALICGMFLIYNTMTFSVVQRRALLGTFRALGVTRRQVLGMVLGEALLVAVLGTLLGLGAGAVLGRGLVGLVTTTINDLYFVLEVRDLALDPLSLAKGVALGIGATLLAALAPAREAVNAPPRLAQLRSGLESRARRLAPRLALAGLALAGAGGVLLLAFDSLVTSFAGLFAVLLGLALLTPAATVALTHLAAEPMGRLFGLLGRMAARGVEASLSRTGVAIAALMVAVSVTVGVGIMIDSFRGTVERWLESTLRADLYVTPGGPGGEGARGGGFDQADFPRPLAERIAAQEGVARLSTVRRVELETGELETGKLESPEPPVGESEPPASGEAATDEPDLTRTRLAVLDIDRRSYPGFELLEGHPETVWPAFQQEGAVIVSEAFAYRRGVSTGDTLTLPTDRGPRAFPVAGVYVDYASDRGLVLMARKTWNRWWEDRRLTAVSVFVEPGADPDRLAAEIRSLGPLEVQSNRALKERSLAIFDRTFLITDVLRLLAGLVAFIGVLSALMALQLERSRELGVLRANGLTPRQVWKLVTAQTGLMGLVAGLLSLPVGWVMAVVMIYVINRRSFGWTLDMAVPPELLVQAVLLSVAAAVLAGLYPAWKMARTSPALALREE